MGDRLYVFPLELLNMWQATHGKLSPELQEEFVRRPICLEIGRFPQDQVALAVRRSKRLTVILDELVGNSSRKRPNRPPPPAPPTPARDSGSGRTSALTPAKWKPNRAQQWKAADRRVDNPSDAERLLWERLSFRKLDGYFFLREFSIMSWWADFYCAAGRLVVEVDGSHHRDRRDLDAARDRAMIDAGYQVLRFPARRIFRDLDRVVEEIRRALDTPAARAHRDASQRAARRAKPKRKPAAPADVGGHRTQTSGSPPARSKGREHVLFTCPKCGKQFPQVAGKTARCPSCRSSVRPT